MLPAPGAPPLLGRASGLGWSRGGLHPGGAQLLDAPSGPRLGGQAGLGDTRLVTYGLLVVLLLRFFYSFILWRAGIWPKIKTFQFVPSGKKDMAVHEELETGDSPPRGQRA